MLDTNQIRKLPEEICLLKNLERLTLSNNNIQTLPENFHKLRKLRSLHCANNKFRTIPDVVLRLEEVEFLDFSDNEITTLPTSKINHFIAQTLSKLKCIERCSNPKQNTKINWNKLYISSWSSQGTVDFDMAVQHYCCYI